MAAAAPKPLPRHTRAAGAFATTSLKVVLGLSGAFTVFTGLNRAFGGIRTLGWQGTTDFLQVVSEHAYLIQDNHTRFLGGVWTGVGLLLMLSPLNLKAFRPALNLVFAIIFLGGLARFTAMRPDIVFGPDIVGSLIAERVTATLRRLTSAADTVRSTGRFDVNVSATGNDEVSRLSVAFGSMLESLDRSRAEQRRLVEDAGHELRTPLTSVRTNLDVLRRR